MTKRERFLKALRNEPVDALVWAPNFDYWLHVNTRRGTLPPRYAGMSRNDIVRAIGATIWNRSAGLKAEYDQSVKSVTRQEGGHHVREWITPLGTIRQVMAPTENEASSLATVEHFVKDLDSLRIMQYVAEATHYTADYAPTTQALTETGDDGIVLNSAFCVPFIQFAKTDAGYVNGFYLWTDQRAAVDRLIEVYVRRFLEGYRILAAGPADVIATGDNMDGVMISPDLFKTYAVPFYRAAVDLIHAGGKLFEGHWCGRTQTLLPLVPGCGLDVVEAIVTAPMADVTLAGAIGMLRGRVVLQGGIPSVLACAEGGSRADFARYLRETVLPLRGRRGFILGMADNVPPNADFSRIESVAETLAAG